MYFVGMMLSIASSSQQQTHPIKVTNSDGETVQILTTDAQGNLISGGMCFINHEYHYLDLYMDMIALFFKKE